MIPNETLERERRWRLILGKTEEEQQQQQNSNLERTPQEGDQGQADSDADAENSLSEQDKTIDDALEQLYGESDQGGDADSNPDIARWLSDIHQYFPSSVAQIIQQDALDKWKLRKLIDEPDFLNTLKPNVQLTSQLIALSKLMPEQSKESARRVIQKVVEELKEKLEYPLLQAINGSLNRSIRTRRPRKQKEINWLSTIQANLKHYQVKQKTIIPETLIGYAKERSSLHDVILCIDQSGSMSESVVYASIFGSVIASVPALKTKLILFDTNVVDVSDDLQDPVDLLFGLRLRGGTNIDKAIAYCETLIDRPKDTTLILISDLFEGSGKKEALVQRLANLTQNGVKTLSLLALSDQGKPKYNQNLAKQLASHDIPSFACTPDLFPELMGAILSDRDLKDWAAQNPNLSKG